ncbi:hypothetical protein MGYG_08969 [Nannizzia gypsea CBS 118893]|uniref:Uncharacterized protein n=1 Tax=Arthroderma gypseum (strain ATCC MYA-4604 / CBS 118893) TaxID=535722 RepID=E4UR73_ARTGP|nr:hypothetical protein MGYG_08969 [Nannizzia gypsea CBS 118893]EFQ99348.1 hypothetical protein MGYG_08969 [Nannizzia gypsea CBS 118893]
MVAGGKRRIQYQEEERKRLWSWYASHRSTVSISSPAPYSVPTAYHITRPPPSHLTLFHYCTLYHHASSQMCCLLAAELFLRCHHIQPCHLKHPLQRCHAPRGQRFRNPDATTNPGRIPSRACPEELWRTATIEVDGYCPACTQQQEEASLFLLCFAGDEAALDTGRIAGEVTEYSCGHRRVRMDPAVLQRFLNGATIDEAECEAGAGAGAVERCLEWEKLRVKCESSAEKCAECRLRASGLCIRTR